MAEALYQVRVMDHTGAQVALFVGGGRGDTGGGLQSFSYYKRASRPGDHTLQIYGDDERIDLLQLDGGLDYQVEFWRRDLIGGLDWYRDFEAFHRSDEFNQDAEGREIYISRGRGFNILLFAEVVAYAAELAYTGYSAKSGAAETCVKEFVDENIGASATAPPRRREGRFLVGATNTVTVEADGATGNTWQGKRSNKNLLDVCIELADRGPGDFFIVGLGPTANVPRFQFRWRYPQWGLDKREGNGVRPPVIFASTLGNATNVTLRYSRLDEVTTVDVLGQGTHATREVETVQSGTQDDSPWARRAVARDAKMTVTAAALQEKGRETIAKQTPVRTITFDARQTPATRYGRDWEVCDLVTLYHRGVAIHQKVVGVTVTVSSDGSESITPELEDVP